MTATATSPAPNLAAPVPAPRPAVAPAPGKTFEVDCALSYQVTGPTDFVFQIHALQGMDQQVLSESLVIIPPLPVHVFADPTVLHRFARVHAEAGSFELRYLARVHRTPDLLDTLAPEVAIADLPDELLHNLMPTRYCESDLLSKTAQRLFSATPPGYARVQAVADWIHDNIEYRVGSTQATTTARDVFVQRAGVCRDFARLGGPFAVRSTSWRGGWSAMPCLSNRCPILTPCSRQSAVVAG